MSISARCWRWKRKPRDSNSNPKTERSTTVSAARAKSPVYRELSRATQCAIVFLRDIAVGVVPEHRGGAKRRPNLDLRRCRRSDARRSRLRNGGQGQERFYLPGLAVLGCRV